MTTPERRRALRQEINRLAPTVWRHFNLDAAGRRVAASTFKHTPSHSLACYRAIHNSLRKTP